MNLEWLARISKQYKKLTYLSMDCVPKIAKAEKLNSLTTMANIEGYRAVIEAFQVFQRCPKPMITAAGKLPPAQVLVIGGGISSLAAIGYCKNLGCDVKAIDVSPSSKLEAESMGAKFLEVNIQEDDSIDNGRPKGTSEEYFFATKQLIKKASKNADIIFTALPEPGKKKPEILFDKETILNMKPGNVIVDMVASLGGNCELTVKDELVITENAVTIIGYTDFVSRMAPQTSELYSNNLYNLFLVLGAAHSFYIDEHDEIIGSMIVIKTGKMMWYEKPYAILPAHLSTTSKVVVCLPITEVRKTISIFSRFDFIFISLIIFSSFVIISYAVESEFMNLVAIYVLTICTGFLIIWNVTPSLHTPLISTTNGISGILVIIAMNLLIPTVENDYDQRFILGALSVFFASINLFGGFIVTFKMMLMFKTHKRIKNNI